jgi:hypothetical protein
MATTIARLAVPQHPFGTAHAKIIFLVKTIAIP